MSCILGLTGGIGSGKTTAADAFRALGVPVVDADSISRSLTAAGGAALPEIVRVFGRAMITPEGALDRARMREAVFRDPDARARLEAILHPLIARMSEEEIRRAAAEHDLVVYDCPLLLEVPGLRERVDAVLSIDVAESLQVARVMARSGLTAEAVSRIAAAQIPRAERIARSDWVIFNGGTLEDLREAVADIFRRLANARR